MATYQPLSKDSKMFRQESGQSDTDVNLKQPSIIKVLFKSFGWTYIIGTCLKLMSDLMLFINPMILE